MSLARALFAGPGACRALTGGCAGEIIFALSGGAYVRLGSNWLLVTGPNAPFGPLSIAVDAFERLDLDPGAPARVAGTRLVLGDHAVSFERVRERRAAVISRTPGAAIAPAAAELRAGLPRPPSMLSVGMAELVAGREVDAVASLAGRGEGLTPAGDDVLAGYAAARFALGAPVVLVSRGGGSIVGARPRIPALRRARRAAGRGRAPARRDLPRIHRGLARSDPAAPGLGRVVGDGARLGN